MIFQGQCDEICRGHTLILPLCDHDSTCQGCLLFRITFRVPWEFPGWNGWSLVYNMSYSNSLLSERPKKPVSNQLSKLLVTQWASNWTFAKKKRPLRSILHCHSKQGSPAFRRAWEVSVVKETALPGAIFSEKMYQHIFPCSSTKNPFFDMRQ